jgi:biopolymer transport protein ExbD
MRIIIFILFLHTFCSCNGQKSKPPTPIKIIVPTKDSMKTAENKNILINITKDGRVYLFLNDVNHKDSIINNLSEIIQLQLSRAEIYKLKKIEFIGVPFHQLRQLLSLNESIPASKLPGIPINEKINELKIWIKAISDCFKGEDISNLMFLIKLDTIAKYSTYKKVEQALTENHVYNFKLVNIPK